ncbi:hypothetical protein [Mycobacterium sp. IS-1556]|uniref:hypothetical protein n=1 Tax=Mycobacterium sp. IS-1556 TaxID=1772276 RepID=UPI00074182E2|nr:hypothetical protein [Mycobacterium sp. IS-1556]KUH89804.1 hypothetical protein AU187_16035 [Mycobacterium sp. IS-1556]
MTDRDDDEAVVQRVIARMRAAGRDVVDRTPAEMRELHQWQRIRCGAAGLLHAKLTGNADAEPAAMAHVLQACFEQPGLTPNAALLPHLLDLAAGHVLAGAWRDQFVEALTEAGLLAHAAAEAEDESTADQWRPFEAAEIVLRGRVTGNEDLEAEGWRLADTLAAEHGSNAASVLIGHVIALIDMHVRGAARDHLLERLDYDFVRHGGVRAPDTPEGLT